MFVCLLLGMAILLSIRFLSGDEDTRICTQQWWIKHGNPSAQKPMTWCQDFTSLSTSMRVLSDRENSGYLPKAHSCEWVWNFPTLTIKEIPLSAEALAIIVEDPDAPGGTWDHLLMANIPIVAQSMDIWEHDLFKWLSGQNSRWDLGRWAPCPPSGVHRYIFKVYAIKHLLELSSWFTKDGLLEKMQGNIIAEAEIIGLYQKSL